jgi:ribose 1,5-bisphosphokinase PhnN
MAAPRAWGEMPTIDDTRRVLVVIGPSGSGKSSVVRALASRGIVHATSSTRPRRGGERQGGVVEAIVLRAPLVERFAEDSPASVVYQIEASSDVMTRRLAAQGYRGDELRARLAEFERERVAGRVLADRRFRNDGPLGVTVDAVAAAIADDFATVWTEAS